MMTRVACWTFLACLLTSPIVAAEPYFKIRVVDDATGRGVPLVELKTVNDVRHYTDSHGVVAFYEPGLMGRQVFFHVASHGYEFPKDGFGFAGKTLLTEPGGSATLRIRRINLAERLYRVTGAGVYRDTILCGETAPTRQPLLNGDVLGSDSVMTAVYRGRIYWFWGDTNWPQYPLGNFHTPGAVSELPGHGGLDPDAGVDLRYFIADNGFAKPTAKMEGEGPTWIGDLTVVKDANGKERMFASYAKIKPPMTVYRRGLMEWNDERQQFDHRLTLDDHASRHSPGHTFQQDVNGVRYVYFCNPYPLTRVPATPEAYCDPAQYESFTCLAEGSSLDEPRLARDENGRLRYAWKRHTLAVGPGEQEPWIREGRMKPREALLQLRDRDTGKAVLAHSGSVSWNAHRRRWVMVAVELKGETSLLGEVWYAEADTPLGPWAYAVKIVTHDRYSFYNPKHHPMFDQDGGRVLYFEGTYTHTFSGNPHPTPRYDYNQIMYRLDLAGARTAVPVAYYWQGQELPKSLGQGAKPDVSWPWSEVAFFAWDRPVKGAIPIEAVTPAGQKPYLSPQPRSDTTTGDDSPAPLFYAFPAEAKRRPEAVVPLYEHRHQATGQRVYTTNSSWRRNGFRRQDRPVCYVWPNMAHSQGDPNE